MNYKKQIEEMAKILCGMKNGCDGCMWNKEHCRERSDAVEIYNAGYRKQSEPYSCGHEKGGEWIAHRDPFDICATEFVCSACRESFCSSELTDEEFFEMMKYCPNCGVKMGGDDNDA